MQLALSTPIAPPPVLVWDELSGNLRQGFTTRNQAWNPGPNTVNSTTAIGFWPSLFLDGIRQSHRARYYNPLTGRFMSRDPEDQSPRDPNQLHKYLYAGGDPVNGADPTGREELFEKVLLEDKQLPEISERLANLGLQISKWYCYLFLRIGYYYLLQDNLSADGQLTYDFCLGLVGGLGLPWD